MLAHGHDLAAGGVLALPLILPLRTEPVAMIPGFCSEFSVSELERALVVLNLGSLRFSGRRDAVTGSLEEMPRSKCEVSRHETRLTDRR